MPAASARARADRRAPPGARAGRAAGGPLAGRRCRGGARPRLRGHLGRHDGRRRPLPQLAAEPTGDRARALGAALSDLAAMAAEPGEAYLALGVPPGTEAANALELAAGARRRRRALWRDDRRRRRHERRRADRVLHRRRLGRRSWDARRPRRGASRRPGRGHRCARRCRRGPRRARCARQRPGADATRRCAPATPRPSPASRRPGPRCGGRHGDDRHLRRARHGRRAPGSRQRRAGRARRSAHCPSSRAWARWPTSSAAGRRARRHRGRGLRAVCLRAAECRAGAELAASSQVGGPRLSWIGRIVAGDRALAFVDWPDAALAGYEHEL